MFKRRSTLRSLLLITLFTATISFSTGCDDVFDELSDFFDDVSDRFDDDDDDFDDFLDDLGDLFD